MAKIVVINSDAIVAAAVAADTYGRAAPRAGALSLVRRSCGMKIT